MSHIFVFNPRLSANIYTELYIICNLRVQGAFSFWHFHYNSLRKYFVKICDLQNEDSFNVARETNKTNKNSLWIFVRFSFSHKIMGFVVPGNGSEVILIQTFRINRERKQYSSYKTRYHNSKSLLTISVTNILQMTSGKMALKIPLSATLSY